MSNDTLAIAIAFLAVCIAWGQWVTARSRLILDLYDKRRAVYTKFHGPIGKAVREGRCDHENYFDFIVVLDEARFLFGRDVQDYIGEIGDTLNKLGSATSMLKADHLPEEERQQNLSVQHACMRQLFEFWLHLDKLMVPYMLMEQKRPWSISRVTGYIGHRIRMIRKQRAKRRKARVKVAPA
jgi:hypothetical protein